uniref:Uncharacterized protein n=1 Tax=Anopheles arabiensis TaxID=7173 RepID=A0A182I8F5_ANOAR
MVSISSSACRLCLNIPPTDSLVFSVFDTYQGRVLSQLIDELFAIKILEDERLQSLCIECVNRINTVNKIKQLFVTNNGKLQQISPSPGSFVEELVYEVFAPSTGECAKIENASINYVIESAQQRNKPTATETSASTDEPLSKLCPSSEEDNTFDVEPAELNCEDEPEDESATKEETKCSKTSASEPKEALATEQPKPNLPTPGQLPQHKCYFCGTVFENSLQFTNHLPSHFSEVPYACSECDGLVFKTVREASRHIGFHDARERPFKCRICPLRFPKRTNSLTHERKMHRFKLKRMAEKDSKANGSAVGRRSDGKGTANSSISREQSATPKREQPECEICSKKFTAKKNLTRHLMIHTGEKPFKCEPCGLSYRQSGELKRHSLLHGEEKPTDNGGSSMERVPDERPKRANKRRVSGKWLVSC